ncbi:MAG: histone-like nucleoid-structuring protein Lsr2 [Streptosporangiaceae bacterium]
MSRQTIVTITDDIDGTGGAQTVTFGYEGQAWEIDLGPKNYEEFMGGIAPYMAAARRASGNGSASRRRGAPRPASPRHDSAAVRQWARENGVQLSERGRIPRQVLAQYEASH